MAAISVVVRSIGILIASSSALLGAACSSAPGDEVDETASVTQEATCRAPGRACTQPGQCCSLVCSSRRCQAPTCADAVKNGAETDIDCGGSCTTCNSGKACIVNGDCTSGICSANVCL